VLGSITARKIFAHKKLPWKSLPIIYLVDSAGVFTTTGRNTDKEHFGRIFRNNTK
jgi:acetyl-CoA carboxylase carboxyltransferase component